MERVRAVCPFCKREVSVYVPKRGDGSGYRPYRHKREGKICDGSYSVVTSEDLVKKSHES